MNLLGEPIRVGQLVHTGEHVVAQETIDFYLDTFGDRHPYYGRNSADFFAGPIGPPLLYHSEVFAHPERWYLKNLMGNLHAEQEWYLYGPLRPGMRLRTRSTLVDRYTKRNRDYLVNEVDYQDEEGRLLVRGRTHQSFLIENPDPDAGFIVDRGAAKKKSERRVGEGEGPEIEALTRHVDRTLCWRFSGPTRNYHTDLGAARELGFPDIVVQGMLSTCLVSEVMANAFAEGWFAGGRMAVKLVNVLWAGETVCVRGKLRSEHGEGTHRRRILEVWVEKQDDLRTVVTVGTASALV
jgi:acyl dehydratase